MGRQPIKAMQDGPAIICCFGLLHWVILFFLLARDLVWVGEVLTTGSFECYELHV